jgi:hypothetical protein
LKPEVLTDEAASRLRTRKIGLSADARREKSSQPSQITPPWRGSVSFEVMFTTNWPTAKSRVNNAG